MITMMVLFFGSMIVGIAVGEYAGKKRARGEPWDKITRDMANHVANAVKSAWDGISGPFRKSKNDDTLR